MKTKSACRQDYLAGCVLAACWLRAGSVLTPFTSTLTQIGSSDAAASTLKLAADFLFFEAVRSRPLLFWRRRLRASSHSLLSNLQSAQPVAPADTGLVYVKTSAGRSLVVATERPAVFAVRRRDCDCLFGSSLLPCPRAVPPSPAPLLLPLFSLPRRVARLSCGFYRKSTLARPRQPRPRRPQPPS